MTNIKCPSCNDAGAVLIGVVPAAKTFNGKTSASAEKIVSNLHRCSRCDLVFKYPKIKNTDAVELYNNSNVHQYVLPNRCDHPEVLKIIQELKPNSVMDFGCYTGELLSKVHNNTAKYGIEINVAAAKLAGQKSGAIIFNDLKDLDIKVDCIVLCDVIEHLDDPAAALAWLSNYLNNRGIIVITTGNSNHWYSRAIGSRWYYSSNAEHISFINPRWLNWFSNEFNFAECEKLKFFRYEKKSFGRLVYGMIQSLGYLFLPGVYRKIQNIRGRGYGIPGLSAWRDHMLIVIRKK